MIKSLVVGEEVDIHGIVDKMTVKTAKNGKQYADISLTDQTGSILLKIWDYTQEGYDDITEGIVVYVAGKVGEYNGSAQITVSHIEPSKEPASKYMKTTKFDIETMWKDLVDKIGSFKEPMTKFVAEELLVNHGVISELYKKAPAARKVHNAWHGGLLEHAHALCNLGETIFLHYQRYMPKLSRDKLLFGLMIHDAGKVVEYDFSKPAIGTSSIGIFTDHLVVVPAWIHEQANKFRALNPSLMTAEEFQMERAHLMHLSAAHHGKKEWGSPVLPASLEAVLVHHLDNLDATAMHALDCINGKPGPIAHFSEKSFTHGVHYFQP